MRTLVIAADHPWPTNSGSRIRLASTLKGLARLGEVELFSIVSANRTDFEAPPEGLGVTRVAKVAIADGQTPGGIAGSLVSGMPFETPMQHRRKVREALASFATGSYDLVWCFRVRAWVLGRGAHPGPTVVDLDDLEDQKIRARLASTRPTKPGPSGELRRIVRDFAWSAEARRWERLHTRIARSCAASVVCSELDARRVGVANARVVPNGVDVPEHPVGRVEVASSPTVVFFGTLRYPPNADACRFLAKEVAPRLRELVPSAQVRLVGLASQAVQALADPPLVTVAGQVKDIDDELSKADVVIVPLRFASGTRVKVLEAFAQRIPVVSTEVGAEGLGAENRVHLLVEDDSEGLAKACADLLTDLELRERLADNAYQLFYGRYRSSATSDAVEEIARDVTRR
jgi:hypothetical protein